MILKILTRSYWQLSFSLFGLLLATPVLAAENIAFSYPPFGEFYVSVKDLKTFAHEGTITSSFAFYADKVSPTDLEQLRELLTRPIPINKIELYNFLNSELGDKLLDQITKIINNPPDQSKPALRGALIAAAQNPQGLTILEVLEQYVLPTIDVSLATIIDSVDSIDRLLNQTDRFFSWVAKQPIPQPPGNVGTAIRDLNQPGNMTWQEKSFKVNRPKGKAIEVLVYLLNQVSTPPPVIVIAPGLNSNFNSLRYVARHLASHGYGVVAINFPETDSQSVAEFLTGLNTIPNPDAWIRQPQDISLVLDFVAQKLISEPDWQGKLDINNVGIIGHSLGGYSAIAVGGGQISWSNLISTCQEKEKSRQVTLNPALIWQCRDLGDNLPPENMQDPRIKAVIALNPVSNPIFSQNSFASMQLPVMIISGSADIFAPAISEQVTPFIWLPQSDKYLALVPNGTHLSFLEGTDNLPERIVGPQPTLAHTYMRVLSLAFFNTYLKAKPEFKAYLTESSVSSLSQNPLPLYLLLNLTKEELEKAINEE